MQFKNRQKGESKLKKLTETNEFKSSSRIRWNKRKKMINVKEQTNDRSE